MSLPKTSEIFVGLMSGTSMDAIDAVAVDFSRPSFELLGTHSEPYSNELRVALHDLCESGNDELNRFGQLDRQIGMAFAKACNHLLNQINVTKDRVCAIGSHGQTIRHQPNYSYPFTLQIGDPNVIAEVTGITTIADFRRRDIASGGQGAPLTPAFHLFAFHSPQYNRVIVNIGGIANLTFLPRDKMAISGFDSGPGNTLLDSWIKRHQNRHFDNNGEWARQGSVNQQLLNFLLEDPYFQLPPPKSTGREYFNMGWLEQKIQGFSLKPEDIQATLSELTAHSIIHAIIQYGQPYPDEMLLCGGGAHNITLVEHIQKKAGKLRVSTTSELGVHPDWVEAIAFAWLARQTFNKLPGNLPYVTGAKNSVILGGIYQA